MASSVKSNVQHRAVYDAFTIGEPSNTNTEGKSRKPENDPFVIRPQTSSSTLSAPSAHTQSAWTESSLGGSKEGIDNMAGSSSTSTRGRSHGTDRHGSRSDSCRKSMIFSPPNCVDDADDKQQTTSWGKGREPVKAAGDVSLSGKQLMPFLIKASLRLPTVKAEGVQLRLRQLTQIIDDNLLSDPCIKKLNFLVDALDRGAYDQAWGYYEAMKDAFPLEMSSNWANGLKLLIRELMPHQRHGRVGSAGSHVRNQ